MLETSSEISVPPLWDLAAYDFLSTSGGAGGDMAPHVQNGMSFVLGRKNYYGSKSRLGTQVAALFYGMLETARKNDVDPMTYLITAAERAIREPGTATLPWET